jgi:hypothetical protein
MPSDHFYIVSPPQNCTKGNCVMKMIYCQGWVNGHPTTMKEFSEAHFKQLTPAEAGRCIQSIKYQLLCAYCDYGGDIVQDENINLDILDECRQMEFLHLRPQGAYYMVLEEDHPPSNSTDRYHVHFLLVPSNSDRIFTFYDVKYA